VHLDDAASATVLAVEQQAKGVFNIVDDEPGSGQRVAALSRGVRRGQAAAAGPRWVARLLAGEMVKVLTEGRGFSNAKAKRELGWELRRRAALSAGPAGDLCRGVVPRAIADRSL
jgi:nucleoside-diphosphate-sugar epimerase